MEAEKILQIEQVEDYVPIKKKDWGRYDGYIVHTNKQKIELLIDNTQNCCERFGYFWTNDDWDEFVGAELLAINVVDACLDKRKLVDVEQGEMIFVNLETNKGNLQFTVYNEHNGYYGHEALIISNQLKKEIKL